MVRETDHSSFEKSLEFIRQTRAGRVLAVAATVGAGFMANAGLSHAAPVESRANDLYTEADPATIGQDVTSPAFGNKVINSIPGVSTDVNPVVENASSTNTGSFVTSFICPPSSVNSKTLNFKSVEILPDNRANAVFCPSNTITSFPKIPRTDPTYPQAIRKYQTDKYRNEEQMGNFADASVGAWCPSSPRRQQPNPRVKVNGNKIKLAYNTGGVGGDYCDEVGQYSEELTVQVLEPGSKKFKKVGRTVLRIGSLPFNLEMYGFNTKYARQRVAIPNEQAVCQGPNKKDILIRAKITDRFTAYKGQTFMAVPEGSYIRSAKAVHISKAVKAC